MAYRSVVTMEKPLQHISLTDWNASVDRLRNVADARRTDTIEIRGSSRILRNESRIEVDWANYETNEALTDRIAELNSWREIISKTFERMEHEIQALQNEKIVTERELDAQTGPMSIISEVLGMRDCRLGSEITYDEPDKELKNELHILENNQRLLADLCQRAWQKLMRLEDVRLKISIEIDNKKRAEDLDSTQLALDRNSSNISYKPDPLRDPKNFCSYENWLEHVKTIKQLAENELADAAALREALFVSRDKARTILQAQQKRTEYTIRKRIFETQRARNEVQWQQVKLKEEMENAMCEIKSLDNAFHDKTNDLKLAETRLENRALRNDSELCLDNVHNMLCQEVKKLCVVRSCLLDKIDESKANFNLLSDHLQKIDMDLENKEHSLMTDTRALELRKGLNEGEFGQPGNHPSAQTDRNFQITGMEQYLQKS